MKSEEERGKMKKNEKSFIEMWDTIDKFKVK